MAGKPGASGTVRNPEMYCGAKKPDGGSCERYRMKGMDRCSRHGGKSPRAIEKAAKAAIAVIAQQMGMPAPREPLDYLAVVDYHITCIHRHIADLEAGITEDDETALDEATILDKIRRNVDIHDRIGANRRLAMQAMETRAKLNVALPPPPPPRDVRAEIVEVLAGVRERMAKAGVIPEPCEACGGGVRVVYVYRDQPDFI